MDHRRQRRFPRTGQVVLLVAGLAAGIGLAAREVVAAGPSVGQIQQVVAQYFQAQPEFQAGDLISRTDAELILKEMANRGWQVPKSPELLNNVLPDDDPLVSLLATRDGQRLMRKVASEELVYDRLDRIARVSGGERMIHDLARLPDGERYVKMQPSAGVPDLLDLLPKQRSGRKRSIKDYKKPTGRVYTATALIQRIHEHFKVEQSARKERS